VTKNQKPKTKNQIQNLFSFFVVVTIQRNLRQHQIFLKNIYLVFWFLVTG